MGIVKNPTKVGTAITYTDNTYSSLQAIKFSTVTGSSPKIGEEIKQTLTVTPLAGKVATGFVASYDVETKVMKYFRDRSLNFNRTILIKLIIQEYQHLVEYMDLKMQSLQIM